MTPLRHAVNTLPYLLLPLLLLGGCTGTTQRAVNGVDTDESTLVGGASDSDLGQPSQGQRGDEATPTVEVPIPESSLLPLLTAEFLLREREYDGALSILAEQAMLLDDPELTRRALRLAEFRQNEELTLPLALRLAVQDSSDAAASATSMALLIRAGRIEEAVTYARQALERGAEVNAPALLVSFRDMPSAEQERLAEAIEALAQDWPDSPDVGIALAFLHREQGRYTQCLEDLDQVLALVPDDDRALILWTQVKLDTDAKEPFDRLHRAVNSYPDNEAMRLQYARLLASEKKLAEARREFDALRTISPRNGDYLYSLALIDLELAHYDDAEQWLKALLALEQRVDEAYYYLGRVASARDDTEAAVAAFKKVGPGREFSDAIRRAGRLTLAQGDLTGFAEVFHAARATSPGQAEALFLLQAELLQERDLIADAIKVLSEGLQDFPESLSLLYARAMAEETIGNIDAMEVDLRAVLSLDANNATTLNALGYTLTIHTTRYAEAAELIERALTLSPGEPAILDSLGWVYFKLGRNNQAIDLLQQAYDKFPDPEVAAHLGEALWSTGKRDAARVIWRGSLERHPDSTHLTSAIERLGADLDALPDD